MNPKATSHWPNCSGSSQRQKAIPRPKPTSRCNTVITSINITLVASVSTAIDDDAERRRGHDRLRQVERRQQLGRHRLGQRHRHERLLGRLAGSLQSEFGSDTAQGNGADRCELPKIDGRSGG